MSRNSKIILSKGIKLDRGYKQVLGLGETDMLNLVSDNSHRVVYQENYSFIKERGTIKVQVPYTTCLNANYMAFQNPDYSNKWFFAFIDKVTYLSETSTEIYYTVDIWSTWWDYWSTKPCYIIREHVADDTIGSNTIPENLEHGPYVVNDRSEFPNEGSFLYILGCTKDYMNNYYTGGGIYNGIYSGKTYYYGFSSSDIEGVIHSYDQAGYGDDVRELFLCPKILIGAIIDPNDPQIPVRDNDNPIKKVPQNVGASNCGSISISRLNSLDTYTPVNNKLKVYPYQYLLVDNNAGSTKEFRYELFKNPSACKFVIERALTVGISSILLPVNYCVYPSSSYENYMYNYALPLGKYPVCNWTSDTYINWLTQNGVNMTNNVIEDVISSGMQSARIGAEAGPWGALGGALLGGVTGYASGTTDVMQEKYQHKFAPSDNKGNSSCGDVITSLYANEPMFLRMSINREWAERLDKYFTRYGYIVNKIDLPLLQHRQNYNYVQIDRNSTTAFSNNNNNINVPAQELEQINNIFRAGVTIWNNHNNFGDYSVSNGITS